MSVTVCIVTAASLICHPVDYSHWRSRSVQGEGATLCDTGNGLECWQITPESARALWAEHKCRAAQTQLATDEDAKRHKQKQNEMQRELEEYFIHKKEQAKLDMAEQRSSVQQAEQRARANGADLGTAKFLAESDARAKQSTRDYEQYWQGKARRDAQSKIDMAKFPAEQRARDKQAKDRENKECGQ